VSNPSKAKGDRGELKVAKLLTDGLGVPVRRRLGAGRTDDTGDIDGVANHVIEVKSYADFPAGVRSALGGLDAKAANAGVDHAIGIVLRPGGEPVVVMTVPQWIKYLKGLKA
jgi:hypothetical protein